MKRYQIQVRSTEEEEWQICGEYVTLLKAEEKLRDWLFDIKASIKEWKLKKVYWQIQIRIVSVVGANKILYEVIQCDTVKV